MNNGKLFVASYSGGKDSILALYRAIKQGMKPVALIITYNTDRQRSWFHGIPEEVLESVSESLGIPIWLIKTSGKEYAENFEKGLMRAKALGAQTCVYGDIDLEEHRTWCNERCANVGLEAYFPLWGEERQSIVREFVQSGFKAYFTVIDTDRMSAEYLGSPLTMEIIERLAAQGVDPCGENGEYHTFAAEGPIFNKKVSFAFGESLQEDKYAILSIVSLKFAKQQE